jgi:hypothetical protein
MLDNPQYMNFIVKQSLGNVGIDKKKKFIKKFIDIKMGLGY